LPQNIHTFLQIMHTIATLKSCPQTLPSLSLLSHNSHLSRCLVSFEQMLDSTKGVKALTVQCHKTGIFISWASQNLKCSKILQFLNTNMTLQVEISTPDLRWSGAVKMQVH
jgi:hypothetical protein